MRGTVDQSLPLRWADCLQLAACHRAINQVECTTCSSAEPSWHLDVLLPPPLCSPCRISGKFLRKNTRANMRLGNRSRVPRCISEKSQLWFLRSRLMTDTDAVQRRPPCRQHCYTIRTPGGFSVRLEHRPPHFTPEASCGSRRAQVRNAFE